MLRSSFNHELILEFQQLTLSLKFIICLRFYMKHLERFWNQLLSKISCKQSFPILLLVTLLAKKVSLASDENSTLPSSPEKDWTSMKDVALSSSGNLKGNRCRCATSSTIVNCGGSLSEEIDLIGLQTVS